MIVSRLCDSITQTWISPNWNAEAINQCRRTCLPPPLLFDSGHAVFVQAGFSSTKFSSCLCLDLSPSHLLVLKSKTLWGSKPEQFTKSLIFSPVVDQMSLITKLTITDTAWQGDLIRILETPPYLARISTLADDNPQLNTFCAKKVLVALGTFQTS